MTTRWEGARRYMRRNGSGYLMMTPYLLIFAVFTVWPVLLSLLLSFTTYNVFEAPRFLGFDNYVDLFFRDQVFLTALQNTFLISLIVGPVGYLLSFFASWAINEFRPVIRGHGPVWRIPK